MATILVIDDEPDLRSVLRTALEASGHAVLEAGDGGEGLRTIAGKGVDLVITDIVMPGMDGIELIVQILEHYPGTPVVAISGGGALTPSDLALSDARGLGALISISKPFEISDLLLAVDAALTSMGEPGES